MKCFIVWIVTGCVLFGAQLLPAELEAAQPKKLRLAFSALAYANPPFWIAHELKLFEKYRLVHDAGVTRAYVSHHYEALFPTGFIGFGGTSAMGWSVPAAMGAKLAHPEKTVVNVTGDGSFGLTGMEIETAARNGIKTLTVILNNESLGASRETLHDRFKGHEIDISLKGDYAALARALGAYGERVGQPQELHPALNRALAHPGPPLLEIAVKPLEPRPWR